MNLCLSEFLFRGESQYGVMQITFDGWLDYRTHGLYIETT